MQLHSLLSMVDAQLLTPETPDVGISGLADDSRKVVKGDLFIARAGPKTDGLKFIADAAARGAVAFLTPLPIEGAPLPQVVVPALGKRLGRIVRAFYKAPDAAVPLVGITGTNGKTTTTYLIRHVLQSVGQRCGVIGTVEIDDGRGVREADLTTPGAIELAQMLCAMREHKFNACAVEVSSHALHQGRVDGFEFAAAAFTNLTHDHQDYHGGMDNYADAKAILFTSLPAAAIAAVNADDPYTERIIAHCKARIVRWGFAKGADYRASDIAIASDASNFVLATPDGATNVRMSLVGRHNIANALTAAAILGESFKLNVHQIARGLATAKGAPGRLQTVRAGQPFAVLVDYAHTPDAMENVLKALRPLTRGSLRVLFGCGGDRDRTKRPEMAKIAQRLADAIYVTSDNPRSEEPKAIIDEVTAGLSADVRQGRGKPLIVETDRRRAIEAIIQDAAPGDVVLLAGKGHENYQVVQGVKHHFDDVEEAKAALARRGYAEAAAQARS